MSIQIEYQVFEIVTQSIFGDAYQVLERVNGADFKQEYEAMQYLADKLRWDSTGRTFTVIKEVRYRK